jgi:hypothetical protein
MQGEIEESDFDNAAPAGDSANSSETLLPHGAAIKPGFYKTSCKPVIRKHLPEDGKSSYPPCSHHNPKHYWILSSDTNGPQFQADGGPVDI